MNGTTKQLNVITAVCIFTLIKSTICICSQHSAAQCILQLGKSSALYDLGDGGKSWGGFLHDEACEKPFRDYIYAMGIRANETGQLYLNSNQQSNCLTKMKDIEENEVKVFSCGIEKLTKGGGSCSDFSVDDINMKLGDKLKTLRYNCQFPDSADKGGQSCKSCINSWKDIKEMNFENDKYTDVESYVCRFAVLVTLTSTRISEQVWLRKLYNCLSNQQQLENPVTY